MTNETTVPVQSLHDKIMRLPCTPPKDANVNQMLAYKSGHRDARHAAAELAAAHEAEVKQAAPVAVPDGWELVPVRVTPQMIEMALAAHYGARRLRQAGGPGGIDMTVNGTNYNGVQAMKRMWSGALRAAPTPPAQQSQADMNAAIDRMRRENNLSIDGDNAYKRDLLDCAIGAMAFGKQGSTPPPESHWLHRFWEIGDAERKERDAAPPAQQSQWVPELLDTSRVPDDFSNQASGYRAGWNDCRAARFAGDTAALEQAEHQCPQCAGTGYDCLDCVHAAEQPTGTTSDKYRAELYDEVWQKARDMGYGNVTEALVALENAKEQAEQPEHPVVSDVRRALLKHFDAITEKLPQVPAALLNEIRELRAMLAGSGV